MRKFLLMAQELSWEPLELALALMVWVPMVERVDQV